MSFLSVLSSPMLSSFHRAYYLKYDIGRILRYLSSHGYITEVGEDLFAANKLTETLAIDGFRAGINQRCVRVEKERDMKCV
jgi:hypothetical protein